MTCVVLATRNNGKKKEFAALMKALNVEVKNLDDFSECPDVVEDGLTFQENARKKAVEVAQRLGLLTIADDSGLEVDALDGAPGVYSARFAGPDRDDAANNALLLKRLEGVPEAQRSARFKCVMAIAAPSGTVHFAQGTVEGLILEELRGSGGFGYDPVFFLPSHNKTMAELTMEEKNALSHRGQASRNALPILQTLLKEYTES